MDRERLVLQTGAAALVFALGLRLLCALPSAEWLDRQKLFSFLPRYYVIKGGVTVAEVEKLAGGDGSGRVQR